MKQKFKFTANLLAIIFTFVFCVAGQTGTPTPPPTNAGDDEVIKVDSRLVVVPVSVMDANNQPVLGLTTQDFKISEENKSQEVAQVSNAEKVPLEIALLFDVSASTDAMFKFEQETAAQFLRDVMRPDDRATVFTIGERSLLIQPRSGAEKAAEAIKTIQPTKQFTAFYDTIDAAANYLQKNAPQGTRKVIVVISDGEDTNSLRIAEAIQNGYLKLGAKLNTLDSKTLRQITVENRDKANLSERRRVLKSVQNADTVFYSINPAGSSYQLNKISQFGQANMQTFADDTGGTAFLPKFLPIDTKDQLQNSGNTRQNQAVLTKIFQQLASELQAQYLVQYYSEENFPTGKFVKLNVGLTNPRNLKLRARQGYFAKN